jgi:hypothetical protein
VGLTGGLPEHPVPKLSEIFAPNLEGPRQLDFSPRHPVSQSHADGVDAVGVLRLDDEADRAGAQLDLALGPAIIFGGSGNPGAWQGAP